jgi:hypothetical protein
MWLHPQSGLTQPYLIIYQLRRPTFFLVFLRKVIYKVETRMGRSLILVLCLAIDLGVVSCSSPKKTAFINQFTVRSTATRPSLKRGICQATTLRRKGSDSDDDDAPPLAWPPLESRDKNYKLAKGEVAVRFINAPGRAPSTGKNDVSSCDVVFETSVFPDRKYEIRWF